MKLRLASLLLALAALFPLSARAAATYCPNAKPDQVEPAPATLPGADSYVYKTVGDRPFRLYVRQPPGGSPGSAKRAAMVFFTGGGWMFLNVKFPTPQAEYFARRGAVTIVVDYRVFCRDGANIVDQVRDVKAAMGWVRAHAKELHVDPARIAAVGGSSGGQLALSTAMFRGLDDLTDRVSSRPNLLVLYFPCVDETTPVELKYSAKAIQSYGKEVSPALHVAAGLPPMFIAQGTADELYGENKDYCAKVIAAGDSCTFVEYKDAPHGFFREGQPWYQDALHETDQYLTQHGYLPPA